MNANDVLAEIKSFAGARVIGELAGGSASDSYLIERDAQKFVLRIDTATAEALGLDRVSETKILAFVSEHELGPKPEFADPRKGILITHYVEGRTWSETDLHESDRIAKLATLIRRLHGLNPIGPAFNLPEKIANYAKIIGTDEGHELAYDLYRRLSELSDSPASQCLCHNDLTHANIVEGQRLHLIDWEYAAIGDPFFDLATVAEHHQFDQGETDQLLGAYCGEVRTEQGRRLSRYRLLYQRLAALWLAAVECLTENTTTNRSGREGVTPKK